MNKLMDICENSLDMKNVKTLSDLCENHTIRLTKEMQVLLKNKNKGKSKPRIIEYVYRHLTRDFSL